jgi:hypothetical protein
MRTYGFWWDVRLGHYGEVSHAEAKLSIKDRQMETEKKENAVQGANQPTGIENTTSVQRDIPLPQKFKHW